MTKYVAPPGGKAQRLRGITRQEAKILALLAEGMSNKQISACLGISVQTVKNHTSRIYKKLGVANRIQAVIVAQQMTIVLF
jgi:LuxR family maltose regulon positive regulatory protein